MACWEMKWNGERERERCKGLGNWMSEREEGPKEGAERKGTVMQPNQLQPPVHTDNFLDLDLDLDLDCVLCVVVSSLTLDGVCAPILFFALLFSLSCPVGSIQREIVPGQSHLATGGSTPAPVPALLSVGGVPWKSKKLHSVERYERTLTCPCLRILVQLRRQIFLEI